MRIEDLIRQTRSRVRLLRALRWGSWAAIAGVAFSLVYAALHVLGWLDVALGMRLIWIGVALVVTGSVAGALFPVDTVRALFELDTVLGTGELLLTLYDLKRRHSSSAFIPLLEHRLIRLKVRPETVFRLNSGDTKRMLGLATALGLTVVTLWFGPLLLQRVGWEHLTVASAFSSEGEAFDPALLPPELRDRFRQLDQPVPQLEDDNASEHAQQREKNLIELLQALDRARDRNLGLSNASQTLAGDPPDAQQRQQQRQQLQRVQQQLQKLLSQLQANPSDQQGAQDKKKALQRALKSLDPNNSTRQSIEAALKTTDPASQQQALERAQQQLQNRLRSDEALQAARDRLAGQAKDSGFKPEDLSKLRPPSPNKPLDQRPQDTTGQDPEGSNVVPEASNSASQASDEDGQQVPTASGERGLNEGDEPGLGSAQDRDGLFKQDYKPQYKEAQIPQTLVPSETIDEWLSRGVPAESDVAQPGQPASYRLSYDRVQSLLDSRDLSSELQDVVRLYFLQIIGQLNEEMVTHSDHSQEAK